MIKKLNTKWCPPGVLRAVCQLGPWIVLSLFLVAVLGQADSAALAGLFQSPPTVTPTTEALPTPTPTIETEPTVTPTLEATPTLTPTIEPTPTLAPTSLPLPTEAPDLQPAPTVESIEAQPITATMPVDSEGVEPGSVPVRDRYPDEGSNLEFEWGMLFDSMALGLSYVWLCCGALFMLLLPLFFLALWVAARRRRQRLE
ncbi:MAG: hypothetical protein JXA93_21965 [Anaerolineae bacterium]|nr:hypothetical protein [Anaerolineae bacterium]